jgi:hypothetical protein
MASLTRGIIAQLRPSADFIRSIFNNCSYPSGNYGRKAVQARPPGLRSRNCGVGRAARTSPTGWWPSARATRTPGLRRPATCRSRRRQSWQRGKARFPGRRDCSPAAPNTKWLRGDQVKGIPPSTIEVSHAAGVRRRRFPALRRGTGGTPVPPTSDKFIFQRSRCGGRGPDLFASGCRAGAAPTAAPGAGADPTGPAPGPVARSSSRRFAASPA